MYKSDCQVCSCVKCTEEKLNENKRQFQQIKYFMKQMKERNWKLESTMVKLLGEFKDAEKHDEFRHSFYTGLTYAYVKELGRDE